MDDVANLWEQINADPGTATPVTLLGGYTRAMFVVDVTALKTQGQRSLTLGFLSGLAAESRCSSRSSGVS